MTLSILVSMKLSTKKLVSIALAISLSSVAHAGLLYNYNQLTLMELDEMNKLVQDKLKESKKSDAKVVPLKEGLQAVYSRPDTDRMIVKVVDPLRLELQELGEYERVLTELTEEALNALKHTRNFKPPVQVTYLLFLENLMADMKSTALQFDGFERGLIKKIKKANIKLTKEAENEKNVKGFNQTKAPSETASLILESIEEAEKEKKAAEKAAPEKEKSEEKPAEDTEKKE